MIERQKRKKKKFKEMTGLTISDMSEIAQHESREKYGDEDASTKRELNVIRSSTHTSRCTPTTNNDLGSHKSSVKFVIKNSLIIKKQD